MNRPDFPPDLAGFFRQHNRRALLLSVTCLVGSIAAWTFTYGALLWAEWLVVSVRLGVDAPSVLAIGPHFLLLAGLLLIIGTRARHWKTDHDKFHPGVAFFSLLSLPARLTFAVWDNFHARVHPTHHDLIQCWLVLDQLHTEKKIPLTALPQLLDPGINPDRVVYLLSITDLIETDAYGETWVYHLRNQTAERHVRRWSKSFPAK